MKYETEDFRNAKFAEHADGGLAIRCDMGLGDYFWVDFESIEYTDEEMELGGWTPVFQPQLTESEFKEIAGRLFNRWPDLGTFMGHLQRELVNVGVEVVEDPKQELPTEPGSVVQDLAGTTFTLGKDGLWRDGIFAYTPKRFERIDWEEIA